MEKEMIGMGEKKHHSWRRTLALLLSLCMIWSMTAFTVFAEEPDGTDAYRVEVTVDNSSPKAGDTVHFTGKVFQGDTEITDLEAAGLDLWWWPDQWTAGHEDGLVDTVPSDDSGQVFEVDMTLPSVGKYYIVAQLQSGEQELTRTVVSFTTTEAGDPGDEDDTDGYVQGDINVKKVENLSEDFIMGLDISSVISEFNSGVTYQDFEGNVIDNITDFCKFLKEDCGITHIRVRVWNDPYDSKDNGYGGGNNDVETAVKIAEGCKAAGLKMLVDFHYSDFWADPGKQQPPKAWEDFDLEQKAAAIEEFTTESLKTIKETGVDIDMVQVGNETTNSFVGETGTNHADMCTLFNAGARAIRAFDPNIKIVIHFTNPERADQLVNWAQRLENNKVDYDILATSYYPYWHGTLENLKSQFETVREEYGKDVMVAETSYAYTLSDTDGHDNTVRVGQNDNVTSYEFSEQGQADCIRDIIAAVNEAGGLGVYYWEPAWITVGDTTGLEGEDYAAQVEANKTLWETYGSGWASSYSGEYDPNDAGVWYGGSAVDNQAMFDADGAALASLHVWDYVKTGAVSNKISVELVETISETIEKNGSYTLPETINVSYSDGTTVAESVTWNEEDAANVNPALPGTYVVRGTVTFSKEVTAGNYEGFTEAETSYTLTVKGKEETNLITDADAAGFENGENFTTSKISIPDDENVYEGSYSAHWYQANGGTGSFTYNVPITLEPGWHTFSVAAMGEAGDKVSLSILDENDQVLFGGEPTELTGWTADLEQWLTPSVTFYLDTQTTVKLQGTVEILAGGWGAVDSMRLVSHESFGYADNGDGTHQMVCGDCGVKLEDAVPCSYTASAVADATEGQPASVTYTCVCGAQKNEAVQVLVSGMDEELKLTEGDSSVLNAQFEAQSVPESVTLQETGVYASSDENVAVVEEDGSVTAVDEGTAYLTYTVKGNVVVSGNPVVFTAAQKSIAVQVAAAEEPSTDPSDPSDPSDPGEEPGTDPSDPTDPGDEPGTSDPSDPGDKPGTSDPSDPGNKPGTDPTDPGSKPSDSDGGTGGDKTDKVPAADKDASANGQRAVKTGDDAASPFLWITLMSMCVVAAAVITVKKIKK